MNNDIIQIESLAAESVSDFSVDPMTLRWGFNAAVREKLLDAQECGIPILPFAKWFPVENFRTRREFHSTDETQPREMEIVVPAGDAQRYLERHLAGKNVNITVPDMGLQIGFAGERDAGKMAVISRVLMPSLPAIRRICREHDLASPIGAVCDGQDELDFDERETCPSCWANWLLSDQCAVYAERVSETGMAVREISNATGAQVERTVAPSVTEFETARNLMIESVRRGIIALRDDWGRIAQELADGSRKEIKPYQHGIRKDLHESKPQDKQFALIRQFAREAQPQVQENGQNGALAKIVETQEQTTGVLAEIVNQLKELKGESAANKTKGK